MNRRITSAQLSRIVSALFDRIKANEDAVAAVQRAQDTEHTVLGPGKSIKLLGEDEQVVAEISGSAGGVKHLDGPVPEQPEAPDVEAQEGQLIVAVDGFDVHGDPAPADLTQTIVHYSREENFTAYQGTAKGVITGATGQKTFGISAGIWHVRVQWKTLAGKLSKPSEAVTVDVEPPVNAQDIEDTLAAAEQIISDAMVEAQGQLDTLKQRLDDLEPYDPTDLQNQLAQVVQDLADARDEANQLISGLEDRVDGIKIPDVSAFITQAEVDAAAAAAQAAAEQHADLVAKAAEDAAIAEAENKANAAQQAAEAAAAEHAALVATGARDEAIAEAEAKANQAKADAEAAAKAYSDTLAASTLADAIADAQEKMEAAQAAAEAAAKEYTDQQATATLAAAATDAQAKADAAQSAAEAKAQELAEAEAAAAQAAAEQAAAADALAQAEAARDAAIAAASEDAATKAQAAQAAAESYALAEAEAKAAAAQAEAIRQAKLDATEKANVAMAEAEAAHAAAGAAYDHADAALNRAEAVKGEAAADATAKANAAQQAAEAEADRLAKAEAQAAQSAAEAEAARVAKAEAEAARDEAIASSATDAQSKADAAEAAAIAAAEADAKAKADAAKAEAIAEAAADATAKANQAKADAEAAAKAHADGLPKMLGGTTAPSGTAPDGSIWFRRDSTNKVIGRWERINGQWVQQEVSGQLIDNLEAGKITALHTEFAESVVGKLWVQLAVIDRLVATSAWIGGAMIGNDAIEAKHITASETLSAKVAEFLKLSVADLVATGAQVDDAVINQLWVDGLVGLSATLARATIAAQNLIPDWDLSQGQGWWPSDLTIITDDVPPGSTHALQTAPGKGSASVTSPGIAVEPETEYMFEMWIKADKPGSVFYWDMRDQNDTMIGAGGGSATAVEPLDHAVGTRPVSDFPVPTSWTRIRTKLKTAPGVHTVHMSTLYFNHSRGTERDAVVTIGGVRLTRMTDGSLIVDDSIYTRHLHVTEDMVGRFAEFLHLVVDRIDVNALWADTSWQREAYFGHQDANSSTYIDGTGMLVHRRDEGTGEFIPAIQFGGGEFGINWYDETGEATGGISNEGDISVRSMQAASYELAGRPIFGNPENYPGEGAILDVLPRGEISYGFRDMNGQSRSDSRFWGFLELEPFEVEPGRTYNITLQPFRMGDTKTYFMSFNYTNDGSSPNWNSPQAALFTQAGNTFAGSFRLTAETAGLVRMIVFVYTGSTGVTFNTSGSEVRITVFDEGMATRGLGFVRNATNTNHDHQPLVREYNTGWPITWWQNYGNGTPGYDGFRIMQGIVGSNLATSMFGYQGSVGLVGGSAAEVGRTIPQALAGATLHSGTVALRGVATPAINNGYIRLHWHTNKTAPSSMQIDPYPGNYIGAQLVRHAEEARWHLPEDCLNAIRAGTFGGFSLHPRGLDSPYFSIAAGTGASSPILRLQYTR